MTFDFFSLGEALIDLISCEEAKSLGDAEFFQRFAGGEPANLARNMALLGNRVAMGTCLGEDGFGQYVREQLDRMKINTDYVQVSRSAPTTLALITRTAGGTPDFIICRGADARLQPRPSLMEAVADSRLVHTSAFAISRNPARETILEAFKIAHDNGALISFDPNYHPSVWPDVQDFNALLEEVYRSVDITKPSLDDCERIFSAGLDPRAYAQRFIQWGAKIVILTMGSDGVLLATAEGEGYRLFANQIKVEDVTGAGDAYWAGFLTAILEGKEPLEAARHGQALAEIKIGTVGPLTHAPDRLNLEQITRSIRYQTLPPLETV
jgi:fructokinase